MNFGTILGAVIGVVVISLAVHQWPGTWVGYYPDIVIGVLAPVLCGAAGTILAD